MKILIVALLATASCRDRAPLDEDRGEMRKPVADDDFIQTRASAQTAARARLGRLNERIAELGRDASISLRAKRDEIALLIEQIDEQGETAWDTHRAELEHKFDELERELH